MGKLSIFWLSFAHHDSTITAEAIQSNSNAKEQHKSLGIIPNTYRYPRTLHRFLSTLMLVRSAIRHFVTITLFIVSTHPRKLNWARVQLRWHDEDCNSQSIAGIMQNIDSGRLGPPEMYYAWHELCESIAIIRKRDSLLSHHLMPPRDLMHIHTQTSAVSFANLTENCYPEFCYPKFCYYPARVWAKGLSDRFCPSVSQSVSQSVCPVKNFEISTFTGLNNCCMWRWHGNVKN